MFFRKKKEVKPEIYTEQTCQSCGEKSRRQFEENDYVYRTGAQCKKCSASNTLISAIYGEYPQEANKP